MPTATNNRESQPLHEAGNPVGISHNTSIDLPVKQTGNGGSSARTVGASAYSRNDRDGAVREQPGFVLHSYPYKETSLIIEVLTRDYGRLSLVAKGAKRPTSRLRGALQTFQPLTIDWSGRSELRSLVNADWVGGMLPLEKGALLCGFYINELVLKLTARDDPHPVLFQHYVNTLTALAHGEAEQIVLRRFELALLKNVGVVGNLSECAGSSKKVEPDSDYIVEPQSGPRRAHADIDNSTPRVRGKTLLDMECADYDDAVTLSQSKMLMRFLVAYHLEGVPLQTRQILMDLRHL